MRNGLFVGVALAALVAPVAAYAQETTSVIRGTVSTDAGAPVAGATVTITNTASGGKSVTTTDAEGRFSQPGLAVGGPYTVDVASSAGNSQITGINTIVGEAYELPVTLGGAEIVVTATSVRGAGVTSTGPATVLTARDIAAVASVNRDVRDLERRDPFATLDLSNSRAVSFAGVNPRFNRFTINGVQVGDNFGLNADANPTGRGPIPFDAISQFSVSIAPFDIRQGNFAGGAINTVMKSGTNRFEGTGFYSISTDELQGKTIQGTAVPIPNYKSETYGVTLAGPIIKDRLFLMVSGERNTDPRPLTPASVSAVPGLTDATVTQVQTLAKSLYNYDTGGVLAINNQKDEKFVVKVDFQATDAHRLSLSYVNAYESSEILQNSSTSSSTPSLGLASDAYRRSVLLRAGIAQLNSTWSDNLTTEARLLYKYNKVGQDPLMGTGFAQIRVCTDATSVGSATACSTGVPTIAFGPDISRQTNQLFFDTWGGSFLARYSAGDHDIKALAEYNENRTFNLFLQNTAGHYYFDSIAAFQAKTANGANFAVPVNGNINSAAADFKYGQYTFGLQDDWKVTDTLTINYGIRYDLYAMRSAIPLNTFFLTRYGFPNTKTYKGLDNFQPRVGFRWDATSILKLRGGVGVFGGGSPDIYLSNAFSNTGVAANSFASGSSLGITAANCASLGLCAVLSNVNGAAVPAAAVSYLQTNTTALSGAGTVAVSPNLRLPSVLKSTLSADVKLFGFNFGGDFLYTETLHAPSFTDLRSVVIGRLPDGRARYNTLTPGSATNSDYYFYDDQRGRSYVAVARFDKEFDFGLRIYGSYTWQDVKDVSPATSSTAGSLYGNAAMADPNFPAYGISNDQTKWAAKYGFTFDHAFFGDYKTTIGLFGETRAGRPYSYTMQDPSGTRSAVFGTVGNNDRYLLYVPTGTTDPLVSYDSAATQTSLENLINSSALSKYRGQIAPKNIGRSRQFTRIDLHLSQEIPTGIFGSRVTIFGDIENLPNLINSDWGSLKQLGFPYTASVVQVACLAAATPTGTAGVANTAPTQTCAQYRYSSYRAPNDTALRTSDSLYLIRIGARLTF